MQKPDPKIFHLAEQKAGVSGKGILFVENSWQHIEAASLFGWQTFHYESANPQSSSHQLALLLK
jgi:HAD superfamily hydrolase (TIGR01509 family)